MHQCYKPASRLPLRAQRSRAAFQHHRRSHLAYHLKRIVCLQCRTRLCPTGLACHGLVYLAVVCAVCDGPNVTSSSTTKEELLQFHKDMFIIRRMEITSDTEYKVRLCVCSCACGPVAVMRCGTCCSCCYDCFRIGAFADFAICTMVR